MLQLADIPLFLTKPLDTSHPPSMTPCTHSDFQTHFGFIKAALKSWLVSILLFFVSLNAHPHRVTAQNLPAAVHTHLHIRPT